MTGLLQLCQLLHHKLLICSFSMPILQPANYWLTTPSNDSSEEVMIDTNFKPIRLTQPVESLFMSGSKTSTVLLRSRDWYFNDGKASKSSFPKLYDAGASYTTLDDANSVELTIEEVSGRKILWDLKNEKFVSSLGLFFSRNDLSNLRLDSVLGSILVNFYFLHLSKATGAKLVRQEHGNTKCCYSGIMLFQARNYIENNAGILEKQFWTDRIKVVGVKDTLDVLFMTSNKSKLYLKYLRNDEEKRKLISITLSFGALSCRRLMSTFHELRVTQVINYFI